MREIKEVISKEEIREYQPVLPGGEIVIIDNPAQVGEAVACLREAGMIGFDTETRPTFEKGVTNMVALLQLATPSCAFLFRLNKIGMPSALVSLLNDPSITKVGLSIQDDFRMLARRGFENPQGFIELQDYVKTMGIKEMSLQKIYAILFEKRIVKDQTLSNWEAKKLRDKQISYAAIDAWTPLHIYDCVHRLLCTGDYKLVPNPHVEKDEESDIEKR